MALPDSRQRLSAAELPRGASPSSLATSSSWTRVMLRTSLDQCLPHGIGGRVRVDPAAGVVDDVGDLTAGLAVEPDRRQVVELDAGSGGGLDGAVGFHGRIAEEAV